jgi:glucose/mannose-6-phosphate isomerase
MRSLIEQLPNHIEESIVIFNSSNININIGAVKNIVIAGLGGSGIGASIVADLAKTHATLPIGITKDYFIPSYVGKDSLLIASSYSGDTEETLAVLEKGIALGAQVVCITSGGKMTEIAKKQGLGLIEIPGGNPPRACLGYSLSQLILLFVRIGQLPQQYAECLGATSSFLISNQQKISSAANTIAERLYNKIPVIYSDASKEGVAVRFRQQINENAKMLAWHHVIPEMNHNELVGWAGGRDFLSVVFIRSKNDFERNQTRMEINKGLIAPHAGGMSEIWAEGENAVFETFYIIHFCDWVSYHLSEKNNVDIMEVDVINHLKNELSKL